MKRKRRDGDDGDGCCSLSGDVETLPAVCVCVCVVDEEGVVCRGEKCETCADSMSVCLEGKYACAIHDGMHLLHTPC